MRAEDTCLKCQHTCTWNMRYIKLLYIVYYYYYHYEIKDYLKKEPPDPEGSGLRPPEETPEKKCAWGGQLKQRPEAMPRGQEVSSD